MRPTLFTLPIGAHGLGLHSYGLAIALGFAAGVVLAAREARRVGLDGAAMLDLLFWILVAGVLGSRLAFVLLHVGHYAHLCAGSGPRTTGQALSDCAAPLRLWEGGLVYYGGALAATGAVALFTRRRGWGLGQVADVLAPALALGHAIGRIGCFFAGCCYGKPWAGGVSFPPGSVAHTDLGGAAMTVPLHPAQLYEAGGELAIFFLLLWARRRQRFAGGTALLYAASYAVLRFAVEIFRGDAARGFVADVRAPWLERALGLEGAGPLFLTTAQVVSLVIGTLAIALLLRFRPSTSGQPGKGSGLGDGLA